MQYGLCYRTAINFMPWMSWYHVEIDMPWHDGRDTELNITLWRIYTYSGVNWGEITSVCSSWMIFYINLNSINVLL